MAGVIQELDSHQGSLTKCLDSFSRKKTILNIQKALIRSQELGDEKLQIIQLIQDLIENKSRQLEGDQENLEENITWTFVKPVFELLGVCAGRSIENTSDLKELPQQPPSQPERSSKRLRKQRVEVGLYESLKDRYDTVQVAPVSQANRKHKKKKKKASGTTAATRALEETLIDPDEPTYCLCDQVSYGEMIGCDNESCIIEWFHFSCVGLVSKPKGKWYCPNCRGERSNQMKSSKS
ncbi:ING2 [Cordylochernes scorpioides]|uniref:Inhibitor of growth protein n=1 Tax=Cordylochernes scorpioides TaxID=51811 RepID=A0ABY6LMJ1_9ARAC|nr:ING2 [Cordylochernes scorpioides]